MSRFTKLTLLSAAAAFAIAGVALAAPKADLNQDGQITRAEFQAEANAKFTAADTNFDNLLTKDEMKALRAKKRTEREDKRFAAMDANGDGALTRAEMDQAKDARKAEMQARRLEKLDTNGDGTIDEAEKATAKAMRKDKRKEKRADRKEKRSERKAKGETRKMRGPKRDANGDGVISRAEFDASTEALFIRMDANGDGVLTKGEGPKHRKGRKGKKRGH